VTVTGTPYVLPLGAAGEVLFIAQQAVSNAIEHGGAQNVGVEIEYAPERFALWVRDDGRGFDARLPGRGEEEGAHFGLRGMMERAGRAGGKIQLESTPGVGTEIGVVLPRDARPTGHT
jgi:signal transduction histidine kinase